MQEFTLQHVMLLSTCTMDNIAGKNTSACEVNCHKDGECEDANETKLTDEKFDTQWYTSSSRLINLCAMMEIGSNWEFLRDL